MVSGSSTIEFGTRNLALHSALSHRTVSRVLRLLRDEPDPLIDLVSPRRMARADRYRSGSRTGTRIASAGDVGELAASRRLTRRSWCSAALQPSSIRCLTRHEARGAEVARAARLSASADLGRAAGARRARAGRARPWRLAARCPSPWPTSPSRPARPTCSGSARRRYKQDRESWRARLRQYQGLARCRCRRGTAGGRSMTATSTTRCAGGRCSARTSCAGRRARRCQVPGQSREAARGFRSRRPSHIARCRSQFVTALYVSAPQCPAAGSTFVRHD